MFCVLPLADNSLHSAFKKDGGIEKLLEHIQLGIHKDGESNTVSCHFRIEITILRLNRVMKNVSLV